MKDFKLKSKGSKIRIVEEPVIKKKKWTLDRLFYLGLLFLIVFVITRFSYKVLNIINGNGQIIFKKTSINFTTDIRLGEILIEEGDFICPGDTLFNYTIEYKNLEDNSLNLQYQARYKNQQALLDLKRDLFGKKSELAILKSELMLTKTKYEEQKELVLLEVSTRNDLYPLKEQINLLEQKEKAIASQIALLKKLMGQLKSMGNELANSYNRGDLKLACISPVEGINGKINFLPNEVCYRQQEVLSIHNPDQVEIQAFFSQKHNSHIKKGVKVKIKFQDGTTSVGKIKDSYIATHALPSEFQKKYEPTERNILLNIVPLDEKSEQLWKKFYLMDAKLTIYKWNPFFN